MTKTTADLRLLTITELHAEAAELNARLAEDTNDAIADYALRRTETEVRRRQRLCRAVDPSHPVAGGVCALLINHGGDHRALIGNR